MDMENIVNFKDVEKALLEIRGQRVILDSDVARLYGVETKRVNEAVGLYMLATILKSPKATQTTE